MSWLRFVAGRLAVGALTLVTLSLSVFWATEGLPGDVVGVLSGTDATAAERVRLRESLGLDRPAAQRYLDWVSGAARGDLGESLVTGRSVGDVLAERVTNSLGLVAIAITVIAVIAVTVGTLSGMRAGTRLDRFVSTGVGGLIALPDFLVAALLLTVFASVLRLVPGVSLVPVGDTPWQHPQVLVLPVVSLVIGGLGAATRLLRASIIPVAAGPYVEQARLNGARGIGLALRHVLPNAAGPAVQALAVMTAGLVGGSIVVETLFTFPGVGHELSQAVASRDVTMVQGLALALGAVTLVVLLAGDLAARALDPTTRRSVPR
ncbi:ABC transporter permease [Micromonospora sp. AMSO31t]|uniref:ABC transporter permease n=1 Tax=Micromonospora sp. AMSO31t TaxID=2650566 RepID=UPI00124B2DEF|nr:ABC transporter permease [Micromonospora sp. AMSO31t]KAB1915623.1 ABC transporter permease [Micromonospora sp. AMSO31t]